MKKVFFKRLGNLLFLSLLLSSSVSCTMLRSNNDLNLHKKYFVDHLDGRPISKANGDNAITVMKILTEATKKLLNKG